MAQDDKPDSGRVMAPPDVAAALWQIVNLMGQMVNIDNRIVGIEERLASRVNQLAQRVDALSDQIHGDPQSQSNADD